MKKNKIRTLLAIGLAAVLVAGMAGCGAANNAAQGENTGSHLAETEVGKTQTAAVGTILLSVNPEIEIDYDNNGRVLEIEGRNEDAKALLKALESYEGQECSVAVANLVDAIYNAGYFSETLDGQTKNIVVKLNAGSAYPSEDFLEGIAASVRTSVDANKVDSKPMVVEGKDLDANGYIGIDKAKELVMAHLRVSDAKFNDHEQELDDGKYEFEVIANGVEYDYEVHAVTGKIMEVDVDNDDWDDRDDWDDWNDSTYDYEVIENGVEVEYEVDKATGQVVDVDRDDDFDDRYDDFDDRYDDDRPVASNAAIGIDKAIEIALADIGNNNARLVERDTDLDDGKYELEFILDGVEYSYEINAATGAIVEKDVDRDDD